MPLFQFVSPKEIKEGKHIVKTPVTVQTSASVFDINQALAARVTAAPDKLSLSAINSQVYIVSQTENQTVYACGNKVFPQIFVAAVTLVINGNQTTGVFKIIRYLEQSGAVKALDLMRTLREEVRASFASTDMSAKITE